MATANETQITPPRVSLVDERTGAVSREWYRWFYSLYTFTGSGTGILPVTSGGTGLGTIPTNGQLLIGNGAGYTLNTLGTGAGISVTDGAGTIVVANTGVLSFSAGTTGLTPSASTTGVVTLAGTLVTANGGTGITSLTAGYIPFGAGTSAFNSSANLFWDNTNASLGIGTSSPSVKLDVKTAAGTSAVMNLTSGSNATQTKFSIQQVGSVDWDVGINATDGHFLIGGLGGTVAEAYRITRTGTAIDFQTWNTDGSERLRITSTGGVSFGATGTAYGTSGQVLTSAGNAPPTWTTPVVNTVSAPVTKTANFTVADGEAWLINNKSGSTCTVTLPAAASWTGRQLVFKNMQAQTVVSASSNVVPIDSTTAGTAILLDVVGNWATMVSDGTNWIIMQAASNNNLLLE